MELVRCKRSIWIDAYSLSTGRVHRFIFPFTSTGGHDGKREILQSIREDIPLDLLLSQGERELIAQVKVVKVAAHPSAQPEKPQRRRSAEKRPRPGRPRKGGDEAALRRGIEITLESPGT